MRSFFCIFCNSVFDTRQQIYEHLKKIKYHEEIPEDDDNELEFKAITNGSSSTTTTTTKNSHKNSQPTDCYSKLNLPDRETKSKDLDLDDQIEDYEELDREFAEWIERFLLFQDSLQNYCKPINPVNRKLLKGCIVCDKIIKISQEQDPDSIDTSSINKLTAYTNGSSLKAKAHVFEHLKYYPFKCTTCQTKNRNKQFSNNEDFKKHNVRMHFKEPNILRKVKLKKLERFVEVTLKPSFIDIEETDLYERYQTVL